MMKVGIVKLSRANLTSRPLRTVLAVAMLGTAVALLALMLIVQGHTEKRLAKDLAGVDLVVGAKGSPLQLILSSLLHLDVPTGNIPLAAAQDVMAHPQVKRAVPLALGDSFRGFRIVGTTPAFLNLYAAEVSSGVLWSRSQQAVIGAAVSERLGMRIGQRFIGAHGLASSGTSQAEHDHAPYQVVGILKPTGSILDRLILTPVDSVWAAHEPAPPGDHHPDHHSDDHSDDHSDHSDHSGHHADHRSAHKDRHEHGEPHARDAQAHGSLADLATMDPHDREVTALLVQYRTPVAAVGLPRAINGTPGLQAAAPALEFTRLFNLSSGVVGAGKAVAGLLALIGALGIFVTLSGGAAEKRYDVALMRAMGARPGFIFRQQLFEGTLIAFTGGLVGILLAHSAILVVHSVYAPVAVFGITGRQIFMPEVYLLLGTTMLGALAALWPALSCYRIDPALLLRKEG